MLFRSVSGYGFAVRAPVMDRVPEDDAQLFWSALTRNYDRMEKVADFGQNSTELQIFKRRPGAGVFTPPEASPPPLATPEAPPAVEPEAPPAAAPPPAEAPEAAPPPAAAP